MAELFYIASLKHTHNHHEHIVWWARNSCGYTPVVGPNIGEYGIEEARKLNDGRDYIAVPVEAVKDLLSLTPYYRPRAPARFYDQEGPVVDNTRANWNRLIAAAMDGQEFKPKPEPYRGKFRSFALPIKEAAHG